MLRPSLPVLDSKSTFRPLKLPKLLSRPSSSHEAERTIGTNVGELLLAVPNPPVEVV